MMAAAAASSGLPPSGSSRPPSRAFDRAKQELLEALHGGGKDRSKKGSLDAPIVDLVGLINAQPDYVTTSSCSGRVALFEDVDGAVCRKAGGKWLLSSHEPVDAAEVRAAVAGCRALGHAGGSVTLKQEPLVLHIECRDLPAAEALLKLAVASGFRESGISLGKKRVLVAVRTGANSLEAPVILDGALLLTEAGLGSLVKLANHKFELNVQRTRRLMETLQAAFAGHQQLAGAIAEDETRTTTTTTRTTTTTATSSSTRLDRRRAKADEKYRAKRAAKEARRKEREDAAASQWQWRDLGSQGGDGRGTHLLQRWGHSLCRVPSSSSSSSSSEGEGQRARFLVFGGFGGAAPGKPLGRLDSLVEVEIETSSSSCSDSALLSLRPLPSPTAPAPAAREQHGAAVLSPLGSPVPYTIVLFGGRASPLRPFGDLWRFDASTGWRQVLDAAGQPPTSRWGHSMTAIGSSSSSSSRVAIYGGRDAEAVHGGVVHLLSMACDDGQETWTWSSIDVLRGLPLGVFAHAAAYLPARGTLLITGGLTDLTGRAVNDLAYAVHLPAAARGKEGGAEEAPTASVAFQHPQAGRYGHAMAVEEGSSSSSDVVWITGGMVSDGGEGNASSSSGGQLPILRFDAGAGAVTTVAATLAPGVEVPPPLVHHAMACLPMGDGTGQFAFLSLGGGLQTFAFGPVFAPPLLLGQVAAAAVTVPTAGRREMPREGQQQGNEAQPQPQPQPKAEKRSKAAAPPGPVSLAPPGPCILASPAETKLVKTALERGDLFDRRRRVAPAASPGAMAVPVATDAQAEADALVVELRAALFDGVAPTSRRVAVVMEALGRRGGQQQQHQPLGWSESEALPYSAAALNSRTTRLRAALGEVLATHAGLPEAEVAALLSPAWLGGLHIERLGSDVLLLEENHPFRSKPWSSSILGPALWPALLSVFPGATRVARLAAVRSGPKRQSQVQLIYPPPDPAVLAEEGGGPRSPGWVTVRENGLIYAFDMTRVMFSSGNVSEKARIASLGCQGETVVDLYAGIGYFTIPLLVHGGARRLVACEWNPDSLIALRHNLEANGVAGRAEVLAGDNRETTRALPDGMADRVHLGLLPSSEEGWPIAARLLRPTGGMLHVHGNVLESATDAWVQRLERELAALGRAMGRPWAGAVECVHLERVKSYAPNVWHLVADVRCGGTQARP